MTNLYLLDTLQLGFIIAISLIIFIAVVIAISIPLSRYLKRKKHKEFDYLVINDLVNTKDYYLLNNYSFKIDEKKYESIDHIIGGNKYFYIVNTISYKKSIITGDMWDNQLVKFDIKEEKKEYIDNPLLNLRKVMARLSNAVGLDSSLMVGLIIVNDDVEIELSGGSKQFYMINKKRLKRLIKAIESREIGKMEENVLNNVFDTLDKLNINKHHD